MKTCSIEDCPKKHCARGWCQMHYARWRRWGDPMIVSDPIRGQSHYAWTDRPGPQAIHDRIKVRRGKAADYVCPCGSPAEDWSYDHSDPDEYIVIRNGFPIPCSTDMDRYQPLCKKCHRNRDCPERLCDIVDCGEKHLAKGLCRKHYKRMRRGAVAA